MQTLISVAWDADLPLDHDPQNNAADNLASLCQRCHLMRDAPEHQRRRLVVQCPL